MTLLIVNEGFEQEATDVEIDMPRKHNLHLIPLLQKLTIQTKDLSVERINFAGDYAWAQVPYVRVIEEQYNAGRPVRIIVLKARQLGISTITQGILFNWCFIHPGTSALVIAHESPTSQAIYEKAQLFWETWPFRSLYSTKNLTQKRIGWNETRSNIQIATAKNLNSGVGRTIHALHASECALWENAEALMSGLSQTIPEKHGTFIALESTARGVGNWFYNSWEAAVTGQSDYIPVFFPWYKHPEYKVVNPTLRLTDLTAEEKDYYKMGCDLPHLEWRRWMIPNKLQNDPRMFMQEYPATAEEAFLTTGNNIFALDHLSTCYDEKKGLKGFVQKMGSRVRFISDRSGPCTIFKYPAADKNFGQYFVAGDPSHTTMGDNACIQVINRRTFEQVAVWHGKCDPITFADELINIATYYNMAELVTEIEGPGYATIGAIVKSGYPFIWKHRWADKAQGKVSESLGWSTNYQRKHWAIGQLKWMVSDHSVLIHDVVTYHQMRNYVAKDNGEMGNSSESQYDDAVMAFAIAIICSTTEGPVATKDSNPNELLIPSDMDDRLSAYSMHV